MGCGMSGVGCYITGVRYVIRELLCGCQGGLEWGEYVAGIILGQG